MQTTSHPSANNLKLSHLLTLDSAREQALRAASFQLESLVTTVIRSCRADLQLADRERLCRGALKAHRRGLALARKPAVSQCFQIDYNVLRDRSIGIARFRMLKDISKARELASDAITAAITPTYPTPKQVAPAIFPGRQYRSMDRSAPIAA